MGRQVAFCPREVKKPYLYPVEANYPPLFAVEHSYFIERVLTKLKQGS